MKKTIRNKTKEYKINKEYDIEMLANILVEMKLRNNYLPKKEGINNSFESKKIRNKNKKMSKKRSKKNIKRKSKEILIRKYKEKLNEKRKIQKTNNLLENKESQVLKENEIINSNNKFFDKRKSLWEDYLEYLRLYYLKERQMNRYFRKRTLNKETKQIHLKTETKQIHLKTEDLKKKK